MNGSICVPKEEVGVDQGVETGTYKAEHRSLFNAKASIIILIKAGVCIVLSSTYRRSLCD